jgi:serine/threonine protein kinase/tetratricopeptide (TPR) repeat protein
MTPNSGRAIEVFTEAIQLPVRERAAFLQRACAGDDLLRQKIEALLESNDRAGAFLEAPPATEIGDERAKAATGERPGDRVDRYKLLQQIGEGGWGVVFLAEQEEPVRRKVALKVVKPGMDTKSVIARFKAERQALALMEHSNIAHVFDAGATANARPYFVMEWVDGAKITDHCDRHLLPTSARLELFVQVCDAIQHAHQKGVIHRDIKPSNILVSQTVDGKPVPKVIDFGIAKATTGQQLVDKTAYTAAETLIGTPAYMSPEQAALGNAEVDTRTDIYSLGVLLYELLTGVTPFEARELLKSGLDEVRRVIRHQEAVRPSTRLSTMKAAALTQVSKQRHAEPPALIRQVRGDLDWIVMKALEKDPARRYKTANGLGMDVQRYLANEPVAARPPSRVYKLQKTVSRNKLLFAGVGIIALLLITGLIAVSAALAKERQSRREAVAASLQSQQVTRFLETMLNGVGPSVARGRDTTMLRDILNETAERVGKEMINQPAVQAKLCAILGNVYEQLGDRERGEKMEREALVLNTKSFGAESLQTAASLNGLGVELMAQHKLPEAAAMHAKALAIRQRFLGSEAAETAASLNDLGAVYRDQGRLAKAEAMAREALRIREKLFRNESLEVSDSLRNLCMALGYQGKWEEAEQNARKVLAIRRKMLPSDHPALASALDDLAWAANGRRNFQEAEALEREALAIRLKVLDEAHPDMARNLNSLGQLLANRGDLQSSEAVLKAVLAIQRKLLGEGDKSTLETLASLAAVLQREGKHTEAESVWREALALHDKRGEKEKPEGLYAYRGLGETLEDEGKWPEAESVWRESLAAWRKLEGNEDRQSMYSLRKLGLTLEAEHKWSEAESIHREALSASRKKGNETPEALVDLDRLVRVLLVEKQFSEAEQLLGKALTPAFIQQPASVSLLIQRVNLLGRRGRWQEAAADAALLVQLQPVDHYHFHRLAALLAINHDRPAYDRLCQNLITNFANPVNPYIAERITQDCLLLPHPVVDLVLLDNLANTAVTLGRGEASIAYFQACKAMSKYRQGDFLQAIDWAEKALKQSPFETEAQAKACAVFAMARWQLRQKDLAAAMLAKGEALAPAPSRDLDVNDLGESWVAWVMARISLDEAATLIQPRSTKVNNSSQP